MVLLIEALGILVAIGFVIAIVLVKGWRRKAILAACAVVVLAGFGVGVFITRNGPPFANSVAPTSTAEQVIFSMPSSSDQGQMVIESLNAHTGALRWQRALNFKPRTTLPTPVASGGAIYVVGTDQAQTSLILYALSSLDGDTIWTHVLGAVGQDAVWDSERPMVMDGVVYLPVYEGDPLNGISGTTLYALRADSGMTVWSQRLDKVAYQPGMAVILSSFAADASLIFVNESDNLVHALRASDGTEVWSAPGGIGTLAVGSGVLYQMGPIASLAIIAIRESDGTQIWNQPYFSLHALAIEGNRLVAVTMADEQHPYLTGVNPGDGQSLWQYPIGDTNGAPVISHGVAYYNDAFTLVAVDASTGHVLWREKTPDSSNSEFTGVQLSTQGNVVFTTTTAFIGDSFFDPATCGCFPPPKVFALNAQSGAAYWQYDPTSAADVGLRMAAN